MTTLIVINCLKETTFDIRRMQSPLFTRLFKLQQKFNAVEKRTRTQIALVV